MKIWLLLLCILSAISAMAQKGRTLTVISTTGLNMRLKPNVNSHVIKSLPWGTKIVVLEDTNDLLDTLGVFKAWDEEYVRQGNLVKRHSEILLVGAWLKVKHGKDSGYLFDAFLADTSQNAPKGDDFALIFENYNCFSNYHYQPNWHWYGAFEEKDKLKLMPVEIRMLNTKDELANRYYTTNKDANAKFMVGSKFPLQAGVINNEVIGYPCTFEESNNLCGNSKMGKAGLFYIPMEQHGNNWMPGKLYAINSKGQRQLLSSSDHVRFIGDSHPYSLHWFGDLDGDTKTDYIVKFGDKSAITILFLSSKAEKGQIVKPVAYWLSGYCC